MTLLDLLEQALTNNRHARHQFIRDLRKCDDDSEKDAVLALLHERDDGFNPTVFALLGLMHHLGIILPRDDEQAIDYYNNAIDISWNHTIALFNTTIMGSEGIELRQNARRVASGLHRVMLADPQNAKSIFLSDWQYAIDPSQESNSMSYWHECLKKDGNNENILCVLGWKYASGFGVSQDADRARRYFRRALAINPTNSLAIYNLGLEFTAGTLVPIQHEAPSAYFPRAFAAEENQAEAQFTLGKMRLEGELVPKDIAAAYGCFGFVKNHPNRNISLSSRLGSTFAGLKKYAEAIELFCEVIKGSPNSRYATKAIDGLTSLVARKHAQASLNYISKLIVGLLKARPQYLDGNYSLKKLITAILKKGDFETCYPLLVITNDHDRVKMIMARFPNDFAELCIEGSIHKEIFGIEHLEAIIDNHLLRRGLETNSTYRKRRLTPDNLIRAYTALGKIKLSQAVNATQYFNAIEDLQSGAKIGGGEAHHEIADFLLSQASLVRNGQIENASDDPDSVSKLKDWMNLPAEMSQAGLAERLEVFGLKHMKKSLRLGYEHVNHYLRLHDLGEVDVKEYLGASHFSYEGDEVVYLGDNESVPGTFNHFVSEYTRAGKEKLSEDGSRFFSAIEYLETAAKWGGGEAHYEIAICLREHACLIKRGELDFTTYGSDFINRLKNWMRLPIKMSDHEVADNLEAAARDHMSESSLLGYEYAKNYYYKQTIEIDLALRMHAM